MASPAIMVDRVFVYHSPGDLLDLEHPAGDVRNPLILKKRSGPIALGLGIAQYLMALAAIANLLYLIIQLSLSSVLAWGCTYTWPLYVWMFTPAIFHILAGAGYHLMLKKPSQRDTSQVDTSDTIEYQTNLLESSSQQNSISAKNPRLSVEEQQASEALAVGKPSLRQKLFQAFGSLEKRVRTEFSSTIGQLTKPLSSKTYQSDPVSVGFGIGLSDLAAFLAFFHIIFAIITFSGLLFLTVSDAIGSIGMRLVVSSLLCRIVVMIELGGLRGNKEETQKSAKNEFSK
jgi:hypothetical protein